MVSPTKKILLLSLLTNACRVLLAIVFMVSGFVKAVDPMGFFYKLKEYSVALDIVQLPDFCILSVAILSVALEFLAGFFLLTGVYRRFVAVFVFVAMLVYTPLTLYVAIENPVPDCGCFGNAFYLTNWETFAKNLFLLVAASVVCFNSELYKRRISDRNRWMAVLFAVFYVVLVEGMSLLHLPVIDFGSFAVGTDLRDAVTDKPSVYESVAVYEKEGVQREFPADALPDSSWSYIGSRNKLVSPARVAAIGDFSFIDLATDEDYAEEILADTGYVALLAIESIEEADECRVDKINDLYDFCRESGLAFYAATASSPESVALWRKRTGAEYSFLWADASMLKTMVRANPGLLLVKDGRVMAKWNIADAPHVDSLTDARQAGESYDKSYVNVMRGWRFWLLLFALPLAFILFTDMFSGEKKKEKKSENSDI